MRLHVAEIPDKVMWLVHAMVSIQQQSRPSVPGLPGHASSVLGAAKSKGLHRLSWIWVTCFPNMLQE